MIESDERALLAICVGRMLGRLDPYMSHARAVTTLEVYVVAASQQVFG